MSSVVCYYLACSSSLSDYSVLYYLVFTNANDLSNPRFIRILYSDVFKIRPKDFLQEFLKTFSELKE